MASSALKGLLGSLISEDELMGVPAAGGGRGPAFMREVKRELGVKQTLVSNLAAQPFRLALGRTKGLASLLSGAVADPTLCPLEAKLLSGVAGRYREARRKYSRRPPQHLWRTRRTAERPSL